MLNVPLLSFTWHWFELPVSPRKSPAFLSLFLFLASFGSSGLTFIPLYILAEFRIRPLTNLQNPLSLPSSLFAFERQWRIAEYSARSEFEMSVTRKMMINYGWTVDVRQNPQANTTYVWHISDIHVRLHAVTVWANPFWFKLWLTTPCPRTLSW